MGDSLMVALVGEQPIPNLLAIRHEQPDAVLLVETDRTASVSDRLVGLVGGRIERLKVPPYDVQAIRGELRARVTGRAGVTYNLTGGTKPMMIAAYSLAQEAGQAFFYVRSEGGQSLIYLYGFTAGQARLRRETELSVLLSIDEYLRAHVGTYTLKEPDESQAGHWLEDLVASELSEWGFLDELLPRVCVGGALEIDLVLRKGNLVAVAELKTGRVSGRKEGIDQLNTVAQQAYLGTYTRRLLVTELALNSDLRELAAAHGIRPVHVAVDAARRLTPAARDDLQTAVRELLGGVGDRR